MYIPLNKIITNLHTEGNELYFKSNSGEYVGSYWKDYKGKIYTGQNPNDTPTQELITLSDNTPQTSEISTQNKQLFSESTEDNTSVPPTTQQLVDYNEIKKIDIKKQFNIPSQSYPQPTPKDYKLGVFTRYFCVKINEVKYVELNLNTFNSLQQRKPNWGWQSYTTFTLPWTLVGGVEDVVRTNHSVTLLKEKTLKRVGLQNFLRQNYIKFHKPN
jgi:hypothetical protein